MRYFILIAAIAMSPAPARAQPARAQPARAQPARAQPARAQRYYTAVYRTTCAEFRSRLSITLELRRRVRAYGVPYAAPLPYVEPPRDSGALLAAIEGLRSANTQLSIENARLATWLMARGRSEPPVYREAPTPYLPPAAPYMPPAAACPTCPPGTAPARTPPRYEAPAPAPAPRYEAPQTYESRGPQYESRPPMTSESREPSSPEGLRRYTRAIYVTRK